MENLWFIPAEAVLGWPVCKHKYIPGMAGPALTVIWRVKWRATTGTNLHLSSSTPTQEDRRCQGTEQISAKGVIDISW